MDSQTGAWGCCTETQLYKCPAPRWPRPCALSQGRLSLGGPTTGAPITSCLGDARSLQPSMAPHYTPCLCLYLLWRCSLLQHRKHSPAFALCSPLLLPVWTSLHPHRTSPLFPLRTHSPPESFHGSPVPRPCRYTAGAQMLKTAFLQHPPQPPISSACLSPTVSPMQGHQRYLSSGFPLPATLCTPLGPHCSGTGDTLPPRPQQLPSLCISESAMAPLRH